jgi:membrane protein YdbS with pleckstrin-like domain
MSDRPQESGRDEEGRRDAQGEDVESWVPVTGASGKGAGKPAQWVPLEDPQQQSQMERPEDVLRRFFEVREIPSDAEVVVAPSMRAAMDVPLKVLFVLLLLFGPFTATGILFGPPLEPGREPLSTLFRIYQFWPLLIFVFAPAVRLRFTRYVVDAEGIRTRTQLLSITEERISWDKVTAIRYQRTLFDRLLGLERLSVIAYGERGATIRLVGLRDAKELRKLTAQKMREHATAETIFSSD